jgi:hypothetical protein
VFANEIIGCKNQNILGSCPKIPKGQKVYDEINFSQLK